MNIATLCLLVDFFEVGLQIVLSIEPASTLSEITLERFISRMTFEMPLDVFWPLEASIAQWAFMLFLGIVGVIFRLNYDGPLQVRIKNLLGKLCNFVGSRSFLDL